MKINGQAAILMIVADEEQRDILRHTLAQTIHRIGVVANTSLCLKQCELDKPELVIVDCISDELEGYALCEQIRQLPHNHYISILALTAPEASNQALSAGADDCVSSPLNPLLVLRRIDNLLSLHKAKTHPLDDQMRQIEAKYRHLFNTSNDALIITDAMSGTILDANRRAVKWLGYSQEELLGINYTQIEVQPEAPSDGPTQFDELATIGHFTLEQGYRTRGGTVIPVEVSSRVFFFEGRQVVLHSARDIRQRKRIEEAERGQRLIAETLRDAVSALNSTLKPEEVIQSILTYVTRVVPGEVVNVMMVRGGNARIVAHLGYDELDLTGNWVERNWRVEDTMTLRWISENKRPLVIPDVKEDPGWKQQGRIVMRAYLGAPIMLGDDVVGFLNLGHRQPNTFTGTHADLLKTFADQASVAIQNARLHQDVKRHAEALETNVAKRTLELIKVNLDLKQQIQDRKAAEEALSKERNLLRTLIDNIPDEIYVKDRDGRIILANEALIRRLGHRAPEGRVIGSSDFDYAPTGTTNTLTERRKRAQRWQEREQALLNGDTGPLNEEIMVEDSRQEQRWLLTTKVPFRDPDDHVRGLVGINHDITELRRAEEHLKHIISGAYCILWYAIVEDQEDDLQWDVYIASEEAAQSYLPIQMTGDQTYAEAWRANIHPDDHRIIDRICEKSIRGGENNFSYEFRCQRADGKWRWLREEVKIKPLTENRYSLVGVCTDITERKEAEETMQRTNDLLEQRVMERTRELSKSNAVLKEQIEERQRAEQAEREQRILAEALSDAAAALSETVDLNEVLDRILTYVARVVPPHDTASVMLIEDDIYVRTIRLRQYDDVGSFETIADESRAYLDALPNQRRMAHTHEPITITDTRNAWDWVETEDTAWVRSYIGVPIHAQGTVIGFLNLGSSEPEQFDTRHTDQLTAFSNQAGIAIQKARLFEAVQRHATDLRRRVKERTNELERERSQLHAILNAMMEGVIYHDDSGHVNYINQSLVRLTGYNANEWLDMVGRAGVMLLGGSDAEHLTETISDSLMKAGIWQGEVKIRRKDGEEFDANVVTTLVTSTDGTPNGAVTVMRDISAEKRLEAQKARFIATASHELRTPITNMKTRLYLVERQPEKMKKHLEVLTLVTNRMGKLVNDLLDVSRFEHGIIALNLADVNVQQLITDVVKIQEPEAEQKCLDLRVDLPQEPFYIHADEARMSQVITNLVTNAINYTPESGQVEVYAAKESDERVVITVRDTGVGIPEDILPYIFQPFVRASSDGKGMGLGLSISRDIVEMHDGEISVESEPNQGTCFIIKLPIKHYNIPPFVDAD